MGFVAFHAETCWSRSLAPHDRRLTASTRGKFATSWKTKTSLIAAGDRRVIINDWIYRATPPDTPVWANDEERMSSGGAVEFGVVR